MNLKQKKAVIFDLDGTLINSEPLLQAAKNEILGEYQINLPDFYQKMGSTTGVRVIDIVKKVNFYYPEKQIDPNLVTKQIFQNALNKVIETTPILPGAIESLKMCKEQGLRLALASSSPIQYITHVLDALSLTDFFEFTLSADELNHAKPHPEVYLLALKALDLEPVHCFAIEDSIVGMIASKAANLTCVVVPSSQQFELPDWGVADVKLSSLYQLNSLF